MLTSSNSVSISSSNVRFWRYLIAAAAWTRCFLDNRYLGDSGKKTIPMIEINGSAPQIIDSHTHEKNAPIKYLQLMHQINEALSLKRSLFLNIH